MSCLQLSVWTPTNSCLEYFRRKLWKTTGKQDEGLSMEFQNFRPVPLTFQAHLTSGLTRTSLDAPCTSPQCPHNCLGSPAAWNGRLLLITGSTLTFQEVLQDCSVSPWLSSWIKPPRSQQRGTVALPICGVGVCLTKHLERTDYNLLHLSARIRSKILFPGKQKYQQPHQHRFDEDSHLWSHLNPVTAPWGSLPILQMWRLTLRG